MSQPSRDPSIEFEPHLRDAHHDADLSELRADAVLRRESSQAPADQAVEHTVWEEPALSNELAGAAADDQLTYAGWLDRKTAETSSTTSWLATLLVVCAAGPWGVLGAIFGGAEGGSSGFAMYTVIGPVTEEIMKIALALWIVEKRPYLFKSLLQILFCAAAGGAAFAILENMMYLVVPDK